MVHTGMMYCSLTVCRSEVCQWWWKVSISDDKTQEVEKYYMQDQMITKVVVKYQIKSLF